MLQVSYTSSQPKNELSLSRPSPPPPPFSHPPSLDQRLCKVSRITCPGPRNEVAVLSVDGNNLSTLNGIDAYTSLTQVTRAPKLIALSLSTKFAFQLSAGDNSIVKMEACQSLANLVTLNLQGNSITKIGGLQSLMNLQWVSLAGNSITVCWLV